MGNFMSPHKVASAPPPPGNEAKDDDLDESQSRPPTRVQRFEHAEAQTQAQSDHHESNEILGNPVSQGTESSGIEMQFPMFVIPIHKLLGLSELLTHQELRRKNLLVERNASMETVIFVSHQWTSFDHPDHTGRQLRTLQRMFERMIRGKVPEVDAPFTDKAYLKGNVKIAPREWNGILRNAYIWIDFAGVPQKETTNTNDAASGSDGR